MTLSGCEPTPDATLQVTFLQNVIPFYKMFFFQSQKKHFSKQSKTAKRQRNKPPLQVSGQRPHAISSKKTFW